MSIVLHFTQKVIISTAFHTLFYWRKKTFPSKINVRLLFWNMIVKSYTSIWDMGAVQKPSLRLEVCMFPRAAFTGLKSVMMKHIEESCSVLTCYEKMRSSSGTGGCSCYQGTPGPRKSPRRCSLWRTSTSGAGQERGEQWEWEWSEIFTLKFQQMCFWKVFAWAEVSRSTIQKPL